MSSITVLRSLAEQLSSLLSLPVVHENPLVGRPSLQGEVISLVWVLDEDSSFTVSTSEKNQTSWRMVLYAENERRLLELKDMLASFEGDAEVEGADELILSDFTRWEPVQDLELEAYALTTTIITIRT